MNGRRPSVPPWRRQSGVVLAVGLMLLLVLTLIGLTASRMTTQQGRMAANFQWQTNVFQGAESAIRQVLAEMRGEIPPPLGVTVEILGDTIDTDTPDPVRQATVSPGSGQSAVATVTYIGETTAPGYSLGAGQSGMVAHQFRIIATSELNRSGARARHEQGVARIGPGEN